MGDKLKNSKFNKDIDNGSIIRFILYFIITIYPFILLPNSMDVPIGARLFLLYLAGVFLLIVAVVDRRIKFNKVHIVAIIFLLSLLIASIFSDYKKIAFFGNIHRDEGFITISVYVLLFIVASQYFKISRKAFDIIMIPPTIMSIYGVFQFYGFDPIQKWVLGEIRMAVTFGTIGHRNFFATYVMLFLMIYFAYYIFKGGIKYLICSSVMFAALICSTTRSGWVAFGIVAVVGLFFIIKRKDCLKRATLILVIYVVVFLSLDFTSDGMIFRRAFTLVDEGKVIAESVVNDEVEISDSFGSSRIFIWKISAQAFIDSPLLGQGPDTLKHRFMDDYYERYMSYAGPTNDYVDKAHNEFLEYAVSGGIVTLLSYCALLIMLIIGLVKNIKDDRYKILFISLIAYIIQSVFNISVMMVAPIVWIFFGICLKAYKEGIDSVISK